MRLRTIAAHSAVAGLALAALTLGAGVLAQSAPDQGRHEIGTLDKEKAERVFPAKATYSPYAGRTYPSRPYFGDTHLHTAFSMDAGAFGTRIDPAGAFRLARGEELMASSGQPVKLSRPLDFLVVADHSDGFGFFPMVVGGGPAILADPQGRKWHDMIAGGQGAAAAVDVIRNFGAGTMPTAIFPVPGTPAYRDAWRQAIKAAEDANDPGRFTAFIGYEWTSNTGGNNLHRNVIFRDDGTRARQVEPFTTMKPLGSDNPADLWTWMQAYEAKTGGSVLAIAHNGNLSNGRMFPIVEAFGRPVDREYAETRARWERLYETTQTKGDGEAHPYLSPNDEFAEFERWDKGNLDGSAAKTKDMLEFEYTRSALKHGLKLERTLGANPYKFGLIGSSDAHTGLAAMEEENFFGKTTPQEPSPERMRATFFNDPRTGVKVMDWEVLASGYAAVWATENTREALWDAMQRRETYATTGTRMVVRFFGGWDFQPADAGTRNPAAIGYAKGVPMGGDLPSGQAAGKSPTFLVAALRDPIGANLDRIQIVKGWLDGKGELHERVHDVAWGGTRQPDPKTGKLPSVGSTVDVANAIWTNTIGAPELIAVWKDPAFDASERAFYYVRVIEIPTPRWTAYDAKRFGVEPLPGTRMTVTERGYTSPIWYTPK
jgi:hypothetical protein